MQQSLRIVRNIYREKRERCWEILISPVTWWSERTWIRSSRLYLRCAQLTWYNMHNEGIYLAYFFFPRISSLFLIVYVYFFLIFSLFFLSLSLAPCHVPPSRKSPRNLGRTVNGISRIFFLSLTISSSFSSGSSCGSLVIRPLITLTWLSDALVQWIRWISTLKAIACTT